MTFFSPLPFAWLRFGSIFDSFRPFFLFFMRRSLSPPLLPPPVYPLENPLPTGEKRKERGKKREGKKNGIPQ
jgi:hypothetical protein